jgi:uncharacterized protein YmfQ (DUF2313 family)
MAKSAEQYQSELLQLAPSGFAFSREPGSYVANTALAWAQEMARLSQRVDALMLNETDPRQTIELMPEWQRMVGLPDPCTGPLATIDAQRAQLLARLDPTLRGQSIPVIMRLAASFGYPITITEPQPYTCDSSCDDPIYDQRWAWAWFVNSAAPTSVFDKSCDDDCDTPLAWWNNALLQCEIRRRAPSDTTVIFTYGAA